MKLKQSVNIPVKVVRFYLGKRKSSDDCENSSSAHCENSVTDDALTIALAVVIPVVVIVCVLGYFLYRNYRKSKKESMEHDPDFDETGEATALPDFVHSKMYDMEDPFHNRNSARYPGEDFEKRNKSFTSLAKPMKGDPYLDSFVLPYQHQTGSNTSLQDYARQIGDVSLYDRTPRISAFLPQQQNSSSLSINQTVDAETRRTDRKEEPNAKGKGAHKYENIPNVSTTSFNQGDSFSDETSETQVPQITQSDLDSTSEGNDSSSALKGPNFGVSYENESEVASNDTGLGFHTKSKEFKTTKKDAKSHKKQQSIHMNDMSSNSVHPDPNIDDSFDQHNQSIVEKEEEHNEDDMDDQRSPFEDSFRPRRVEIESDAKNTSIDGDFDFSTDNTSQFDTENANDTEFTSPANTNHLEQPSNTTSQRRKSPRISAFNMLKNDSDDEDVEEIEKGLTEDQKEELKRMKSVYKVYFEGNGKNRVEGGLNNMFPENSNLGGSDTGFLTVNRDLKVDSDYDKRLTTTSSIYNDTPIFANEEEEIFQAPPVQYVQQPMQYYGDPNSAYASNYEQLPPPELPPLQNLKNASDIRKSSLQTYTDFKPNAKGITSPNAKQPFNPIDNDSVWTSSINHSTGQPQQTFYDANPDSQNSLSTLKAPTVPSATQLSRSSVVMLNPVTEITKQRKYKPAGSLPTMSSNNINAMLNPDFIDVDAEVGPAKNDLIPSNRKSDLRRMMNSNF